jgi:hypothetical protein
MTTATAIRKPPKPRRPLYLAAPIDSIALGEEAEALLHQHPRATAKELVALAGNTRSDLATMLLYRACRRGENGAFLERMSHLPSSQAPLATQIRLLIVPGFLFAEHPELAIDGALIRDIATRLGAEAEIVDVNSRGVSQTNGELLAEQLRSPANRPTWMLSISKGTTDARAAFDRLGGWPETLSGWIDVSGIFSGTPIADWWTEETVRRWLVRALFGLTNLPFGTLLEMRRDAAIWRRPVTPPERDRLIHVLGFPPPWCIEPRMARNYRRLLAEFGPNDGFTPLADAFDYPGRLYPVWGADHLMRLPDLASLVYRIIHMAAAVEAGTLNSQLSKG